MLVMPKIVAYLEKYSCFILPGLISLKKNVTQFLNLKSPLNVDKNVDQNHSTKW